MQKAIMTMAQTCMLAALSTQLLGNGTFVKAMRFVLGLEIMRAALDAVGVLMKI